MKVKRDSTALTEAYILDSGRVLAEIRHENNAMNTVYYLGVSLGRFYGYIEALGALQDAMKADGIKCPGLQA